MDNVSNSQRKKLAAKKFNEEREKEIKRRADRLEQIRNEPPSKRGRSFYEMAVAMYASTAIRVGNG